MCLACSVYIHPTAVGGILPFELRAPEEQDVYSLPFLCAWRVQSISTHCRGWDLPFELRASEEQDVYSLPFLCAWRVRSTCRS